MENQSDNTELSSGESRLLRVVQTLANGNPVAAHVITAPDRSRDFPSLPISDHHAVVVVEPVVDFVYRWNNGLLKRHTSSNTPAKYIITYREIDQNRYEEYSEYAQGAEEKDLLSRKVEKHEAFNIEELRDILTTYDLQLYDLRLARMTD